MAAYVIYARKEITDEQVAKRYSEQAVPQIRACGGELLAARGAVHHLREIGIHAGDDPEIRRPRGFDALVRLPEYAPLKQMRLDTNIGDIFVVAAT